MMASGLGEKIQTADWKKEKHVPVIDAPATVKTGEVFDVTVGIGKEVAHPNETKHHIRWISLYYQPEGEHFTYQVGHFEFTAHGESTSGPDEGPVYTHHRATASMKLSKAGTLYAMSLCNIHGLWQSEKAIAVN
jgi:superoxide reductase